MKKSTDAHVQRLLQLTTRQNELLVELGMKTVALRIAVLAIARAAGVSPKMFLDQVDVLTATFGGLNSSNPIGPSIEHTRTLALSLEFGRAAGKPDTAPK